MVKIIPSRTIIQIWNIRLHELLWLIRESSMASTVKASQTHSKHIPGVMSRITQRTVHRSLTSGSGCPGFVTRRAIHAILRSCFLKKSYLPNTSILTRWLSKERCKLQHLTTWVWPRDLHGGRTEPTPTTIFWLPHSCSVVLCVPRYI